MSTTESTNALSTVHVDGSSMARATRHFAWLVHAYRPIAWKASSRRSQLLAWWYLSLLGIAAVFKYFNTGWGDLLKTTSTSSPFRAGQYVHLAELFARVFRVYRADILQSFAVVALLAVVGNVICRLRLSFLAWLSISTAFFTAVVEWIALRQTGMPLTYANLVVSIEWAKAHPSVIPTVLPWTAIIVICITGVAFGALPALLAKAWARHRVDRRVLRGASVGIWLLLASLLAGAACTHGPIIPRFSQTHSPTDGFWTSSIAALANLDSESPVNLPIVSRDDHLTQYYEIAYPFGRDPTAALLPAAIRSRVLRHVVLIVLETAPRPFYQLADDSTYPTFNSMATASIVSTHHHTTRPSTLFAIYSMLTGTYPRPGVPIGEFGRFRNDGLASTLADRRYETTYIDSYLVDWGYHYRAELKQQGFRTILDTAGFRAPFGVDPFRVAVERERWSLSEALRSVEAAQSRRSKSFVVVATTLGHFPWRAPRTSAGLSSEEKVHGVGVEIDSAVGTFLHGLDSLNLRDSTIVIVTGDHGLRYTAEFQSFGFTERPDSVDFHVPFMLYAPGLIKSRIDIPYATSHIDIAPTVFYLLGLRADSLVLHGENMLDTRLADRAIFLMNTGLYPVDAFEVRRHRFSSNTITEATHVSPALYEGERERDSKLLTGARERLKAANHLFNLTAAYFLSHGISRVDLQ